LSSCGGLPRAAKDSFGTLLLEAMPIAQLRDFARGLGLGTASEGRRGSKARLLARLCDVARQQLSLEGPSAGGRKHKKGTGTAEARLVTRALQFGRWVCIAPSDGRAALSLLTELFHLEALGAADSSFMVFSTRWPEYKLEQHMAAPPLFESRAALDEFLCSRQLVHNLESATEQRSADVSSTVAQQA